MTDFIDARILQYEGMIKLYYSMILDLKKAKIVIMNKNGSGIISSNCQSATALEGMSDSSDLDLDKLYAEIQKEESQTPKLSRTNGTTTHNGTRTQPRRTSRCDDMKAPAKESSQPSKINDLTEENDLTEGSDMLQVAEDAMWDDQDIIMEKMRKARKQLYGHERGEAGLKEERENLRRKAEIDAKEKERKRGVKFKPRKDNLVREFDKTEPASSVGNKVSASSVGVGSKSEHIPEKKKRKERKEEKNPMITGLSCLSKEELEAANENIFKNSRQFMKENYPDLDPKSKKYSKLLTEEADKRLDALEETLSTYGRRGI